MRSKEIVLYGHSGSGNHGCEAIIRSTLKLIGKDCLIYSNNVDQDIKYGINEKILRRYSNYIPRNSIRRYFYAIYCRIFKQSMTRYKYAYRPFLNNIEKGKIYLSVGGDHYCYGTYSNHIYNFLNDTIKEKGGKSVLWSCSVAEEDLDEETIESLKRYDLITARESITYQSLIKNGIDRNVVLIPDVAFQLEAKECILPEGFQDRNTVGINISPMIQKYGNDGRLIMQNYEKVVQYILETTDCSVALIPHVVWEDTDDRVSLRNLFLKFKQSKRIVMVEDMSAENLKFVISRCCFFIGARTHATIAAYSSCVPTLVIGYSVKARGIAKDIFNTIDEYVVSVQQIKDTEALIEKFIPLWEKRINIQNYLEKMMPDYCKTVWKCKKEIDKLLYEKDDD